MHVNVVADTTIFIMWNIGKVIAIVITKATWAIHYCHTKNA